MKFMQVHVLKYRGGEGKIVDWDGIGPMLLNFEHVITINGDSEESDSCWVTHRGIGESSVGLLQIKGSLEQWGRRVYS